jgi:hypothetical protein
MGRENYYKTTTDHSLTKEQKLEIIEAVQRGVGHIKSQLLKIPTGPRIVLTNDILNMIIHNIRLVEIHRNLTKGYTEPKELFNRTRNNDINLLSKKISEETGVNQELIKDELFELLSDYVSRDYYSLASLFEFFEKRTQTEAKKG